MTKHQIRVIIFKLSLMLTISQSGDKNVVCSVEGKIIYNVKSVPVVLHRTQCERGFSHYFDSFCQTMFLDLNEFDLCTATV